MNVERAKTWRTGQALGQALASVAVALSGCGGGGNDGSGEDPPPGFTQGPTSSPANTPDAPVASLQATRLSGAAPLAVLFDATGTTAASDTDAFRQVTYAFNFGDERGQDWGPSGSSKNTQTGGPIAAHVFETPGTYTVRMRATNAAGAYSESTVTISVDDADTVYARTKTVCVSASSNFSGCPSDAATQTSLPSSMNGKRILLRRGESFGDIAIRDGNSGVQVGAFGTGNKPRVSSVGVGTGRPSTANFANDITVMDLDVSGKLQQNVGHRVLFLRNTVAGQGETVALEFGGPGYWGASDPYRFVPPDQFYNARELFLVENTVVGSSSLPMVNAYGNGSRLAIMGNVMGNADQHTLRVTRAHKAVIAHNELRGVSSDGMRHVLKLHSGSLRPYADSFTASNNGDWASRHVVVSHNVFGSSADNNQWTVAIAPQNDIRAEGIEDVLVENNRFIRGSNTVADLVLAGRRITYRGNTRADGSMSVNLGGHAGALPAEWQGPYFPQ